jgi:hypothetical protein
MWDICCPFSNLFTLVVDFEDCLFIPVVVLPFVELTIMPGLWMSGPMPDFAYMDTSEHPINYSLDLEIICSQNSLIDKIKKITNNTY